MENLGRGNEPRVPAPGLASGAGKRVESAGMKAVIHSFSGTGNTARAVQVLGAQLAGAGYEVAQRGVDGRAEPPAETSGSEALGPNQA